MNHHELTPTQLAEAKRRFIRQYRDTQHVPKWEARQAWERMLVLMDELRQKASDMPTIGMSKEYGTQFN